MNNTLTIVVKSDGAVGFEIIESGPVVSGPHTNGRAEQVIDYRIKRVGKETLDVWRYRAIKSSHRSESAHTLSWSLVYGMLDCTVAMWPRISPASARALLMVQYCDSFGFDDMDLMVLHNDCRRLHDSHR